MKNLLLACLPLLFMPAGMSCHHGDGHSASPSSIITGRISPANAASRVWMVEGGDSTPAYLIGGNFSVALRPETYTLVIAGNSPYQNASVANIEVGHYPALDVGEIILHP